MGYKRENIQNEFAGILDTNETLLHIVESENYIMIFNVLTYQKEKIKIPVTTGNLKNALESL